MSETIHTCQLPGGMVLVAEEMPWLRSAAFTFLVPAGSVFEPKERAGLAGFTCEMMLRGAGDRDNRQLILDLDTLGVDRSESVGPTHIGFSGVALAERLPDVLSIYADLLRRPQLPEEQLEAGRQIMLQELSAVEDEPAQKSILELRRTFFADPWGRPHQGNEPGILAVTSDEIRRFWQNHYSPKGTILGVAGRFDWPTLREEVQRLFADWTPMETDLPAEVVSPSSVRHIPFESGQTHVTVGFETVPYRDENYFEAWGATGVLGGGMSSRLATEVREHRGLCYTVYAYSYTLRDKAGVLCYSGTSADRANETLEVMVDQLRRLREGVETEELDRLKSRIKSALVMQQESSSSRSSSIARDWYHLGRVRSMDEVSERLDRLSAASINAYLESHPPGDFTVVTLGPRELEVSLGVSES